MAQWALALQLNRKIITIDVRWQKSSDSVTIAKQGRSHERS